MRGFIDHVVSTGSASAKRIYITATCANACGDGTCNAAETCTGCLSGRLRRLPDDLSVTPTVA